MIPGKSFERISGEPLIAVSTSPCSICALAAGLPGSGWSKIAPYGTAMPRLAANSAVIGLTATPIQAQRSLPFLFSCVTVALHKLCVALNSRRPPQQRPVAVGTRFASCPPHRTVQAAFPHTACMGLLLSRGHHTFFCRAVASFFCSTRAASILPSRPHITIAVARSEGQGRRFFSAAEGLVLDHREH